MSKYDNHGLPKFQGKGVPAENKLFRCSSKESRWTSLISLPPPPPVVLPNPQDRRIERFNITKALLAMKHEDGKPVCAHVL